MKLKAVLLVLTCLALASCSTFSPSPTVTPTPLPTSTPTDTPTPLPTDTPIPTATLAPTETPDPILARIPTGEPAESWNGIPIMPDAIFGNETDYNYYFTTQSTANDIQKYYERELGKLGASNCIVGEGIEKESIDMMCFFFGDALRIVLVEIIPYNDFMLVILGE